jgi:NAD(P)-dependent dehydrogenase (short-subunit alcohol dehydrogenase family)
MRLLDKKVAIVTGAGSGIGRAIAIKYAEAGAKVVVSDLNEKAANETVNIIHKNLGDAIFISSDSSSAESNKNLVDETIKRFGALHIACNNAGIGGVLVPTGEYPIEMWEKVIATNLSGVFYGMRYQIPAMIAAGEGSIINVASILGQVGTKYAPAYVAAKHGVVGLTKTAALDYSDKGIRINSVGPGYIKTPLLTNSLTEEQMKPLVGLHPIGRLGEPEEVAELVLWLSSSKASFVTGTYFAIDGGYLAQ